MPPPAARQTPAPVAEEIISAAVPSKSEVLTEIHTVESPAAVSASMETATATEEQSQVKQTNAASITDVEVKEPHQQVSEIQSTYIPNPITASSPESEVLKETNTVETTVEIPASPEKAATEERFEIKTQEVEQTNAASTVEVKEPQLVSSEIQST